MGQQTWRPSGGTTICETLCLEARRLILARREGCSLVYEVANEFRIRCLEQDGSLLWDRPGVWTIDNLKLIQTHFLDAPDTTTGLDFWSKLKQQFQGLPAECFMILSDALVVYSLPSMTMTTNTKMSFLERVHEIGGPEPPELNGRIVQAFGQGLTHTTLRYHAKYMELWLLVRFALHLKEKAAQGVLADPWDTARFLDECLYSFRPVDRAYEMRHALLHLLFPDVFESVISTRHKTQIASTFLTSSEVEATEKELSAEGHSPIVIDHLLLKARERLQSQHPGSVVDFYSPELERQWRKEQREPEGPENGMSDPFSTIFADREEALWAFEVMSRVIKGLGLGSTDDPRLVISLARGGEALHLIFCNWLVLGFNAPAYEPKRFEVLLLENTATSLIHRKEIFTFKQKDDEPKLNCYAISTEEAQELGDRLVRGIEEALPSLLRRFSSYQFSPYKRFHVRALHQAALNPVYRVRILKDGLQNPPPPLSPNYWVFQVDPSLHKMIDSLRDGRLKTMPIMAREEDIRKGDKAILWVKGAEGGCYALITVSSDPYLGYADEEVSGYHVRPDGTFEEMFEETVGCEVSVDLLLADKPISRDQVVENPVLRELPIDSEEPVRPVTTEQYEEMLRLASGVALPDRSQTASTNPEYSLTQMSAETGFAEEELARWVRAIDRKGQAIFYGPPGTGKTFIATRLGKHLIGGSDGFIEIVQFHPAYTYEDFIQGIRVKTLQDGRLSYPMEPGRFLQFCTRARRRTGRCVLVIDEINRANLSRVFGELMYLLEYRDREIPLAGDGRLFSLPANVRIIGTMNTADRSIALVDHALRRRFAFIQLRPKLEILRRHHARTEFPVENLIRVLSRLNAQIGDPNFEVGISFFMGENLDLHSDLQSIWQMEIEPYLEEYFFDQPSIVNEFRWTKVKGEIFP